jgi:thiamine biosynthesis lipoprotein ApbE
MRKRSCLTALTVAALTATPAQGAPIAPSNAALVHPPCDARLREFTFAHDHILGTSLDLLILADHPRAAGECHRRILAEIERLRRVLSTYDSASEVSRAMRGAPITSSDLATLLDLYAQWSARTGGALHVNMAAVKSLWQRAATEDRLPSNTALKQAFATPLSLNVDALGKAWIIDRAVDLARRLVPAGLLDIGGDLCAWGDHPFTIAVADPDNPADNAPPLTTLTLQNNAIATSGGYARPLTIAGRHYSHLIDPRTLQPVPVETAATVCAPDCVTANALATTACILGAQAATPIAAQHSATLIPAARSFATPTPIHLAANPWPKDYQLTLTLTLKVPQRDRKPRRPYVAVWIEDAKGKLVRTITVWGTQPKYLREMTGWWQAVGGPSAQTIKAVTRATRDPGKYTIAWDGLDDAGKPVSQGDYTVVCEINREHGRHAGEKTRITCAAKKASATQKATAESEDSPVDFAPKPAN